MRNRAPQHLLLHTARTRTPLEIDMSTPGGQAGETPGHRKDAGAAPPALRPDDTFAIVPQTVRPAHPTANVLVIDADPDILDLVRNTRAGKGHHVLATASGAQGVVLAEREEPDLIVLDIQMPGLNGYQVCQHLSANGLTAHIPVLAVGRERRPEDIARMLTGFADDYLVKPFHPEELAARVAALLRRTLRWTRSKNEQIGVFRWIAERAMRRGFEVSSRHLKNTNPPPSAWKGPLPDVLVTRGPIRVAYLVETLESLCDARTLARWESIERNPHLRIRMMVTSPEGAELAHRLAKKHDFRASVEVVQSRKGKQDKPAAPGGRSPRRIGLTSRRIGAFLNSFGLQRKSAHRPVKKSRGRER